MSKIAMSIALLLVFAACGDEPESLGAASSTSSTTTTAAVEGDVTTTTEETTTSSTLGLTAETSSTTSTLALAAPGPTFGFYPDGLGIANFGDSPATVIAAMTGIFGPPTVDTGWVDEILCPGPMNRFMDFSVELFDFRLMFTTGGLFAPEGTEQFYSYNYKGATPVPVSPPDLTVGTTVAQLMALYPAVTFPPNPFIVGVTDYHVDAPGNAQLHGQLTDPGPAGTVVNVQGGIGCGE